MAQAKTVAVSKEAVERSNEIWASFAGIMKATIIGVVFVLVCLTLAFIR